MRAVEVIQREVWGLDDIDIVPSAQLRAAVHAGGQLAGAFLAGTLIGFAYGLVATPHGRGTEGVGIHSHMVAVREQGRRRGVGRGLKWFQRRWCLERGMSWMTWTFDPLQARNANLNFAHLGAISHEYLPDFYGPMAGPLGGRASDRLVALWLLDSDPVAWRAEAEAEGAAGRGLGVAGRGPGALPGDAVTTSEVWVLREEDVMEATRQVGRGPDAGGDAVRRALALSDPGVRLRVAAPRDVRTLQGTSPALVDRWRDGLRATIVPALAAGYSVVGFWDGAYALERSHP